MVKNSNIFALPDLDKIPQGLFKSFGLYKIQKRCLNWNFLKSLRKQSTILWHVLHLDPFQYYFKTDQENFLSSHIIKTQQHPILLGLRELSQITFALRGE